MANEKSHLVETEVRIAHMVELMLANEWKTGKTVKQLADEWGISRQRARELSAEASRIVRQEHLANVVSKVVPTLEAVMERGQTGAIPGDLAAAVSAAKVLAEMAGLNEPDKVQSESTTPRTITVTYHASVQPQKGEEPADG